MALPHQGNSAMLETGARVWVVIIMLGGLLGGCAANWNGASATSAQKPQQSRIRPTEPVHQVRSVDFTCRKRVVTNQELLQWSRKDPALTPAACRKILARLNNRAEYLIFDAIAQGRPLEVPDDFLAYRDWTPLPRVIPALRDQPKFILVVKDHPFLGWYQNGKLLGDAFAGIGRPGEATETGLFRVLQKDSNHYSGSYNNAYGSPAWMPWALRIYDHVWIHAGDVTGPYSSHGCIMLPPGKATALFRWADKGTAVLIVATLADLKAALAQHSSELTIRPSVSAAPLPSVQKN